MKHRKYDLEHWNKSSQIPLSLSFICRMAGRNCCISVNSISSLYCGDLLLALLVVLLPLMLPMTMYLVERIGNRYHGSGVRRNYLYKYNNMDFGAGRSSQLRDYCGYLAHFCDCLANYVSGRFCHYFLSWLKSNRSSSGNSTTSSQAKPSQKRATTTTKQEIRSKYENGTLYNQWIVDSVELCTLFFFLYNNINAITF